MSAARPEVARQFDRLSNFRDAGGLMTADGRTVRTGLLFRSGDLSLLTERDLAALRQFDIKLICDLRSPEESRKRQPLMPPGTPIRVVNIPLHERVAEDSTRIKLLGFLFGRSGGERFREFSRRYYRHMAFEQTARIREVITLLATDGNLPALIHCNAGKDRTGFMTAVIQLLVGVPYQLVMEDYLRTNDYFRPRLERFIRVMRAVTLFQVSEQRMRLILMAHAEFLQEVHDVILERYGSVENYLVEACEIDRDTLGKLKSRLVD